MADYPEWFYFPDRERPPSWVPPFIAAIDSARESITSSSVTGLTSDKVLGHLRPGLEALGFRVEAGKAKAQKVTLPVLFGPQGRERVRYEVDAVHDELGVVVEVEAGRGARGNAVYRDLIRSSLIVDARYLALGVMSEYHHRSGGRPVVVHSFEDARDQLDAIYASQRLRLPFEGVLLFGY